MKKTDEPIYIWRKKIREIRSELEKMGDKAPEMPELVDSANLLRANQHLSKTGEKKTELLSAYVKYSDSLEKTLSMTLDIQNDLREILEKQSSMITKKSRGAKPRRSK